METSKRPLLLNQVPVFPLSIIKKLGAKYHEHTAIASGYFLHRSLRSRHVKNTYF